MFNTNFRVLMIAIFIFGSILITESNRRQGTKQFRGNTNYQHFLELEQRRKTKSLEAQKKLVVETRRDLPQNLPNRTEVIRKRKASFHQEIDNDIQQENNEVRFRGFLSPSVRKYLALGRAIPGRPGTDYPILSKIPYTNFYCDDQEFPGFFADMETRCQGWHYCDIDGRQATFLCPNGTQFSQAVLVCDWWFNVNCELSPKLYAINDRLYRKPKVNPIAPHRTITKQLIEEIFN